MNIFNTIKLLSIAGLLSFGLTGCDVDVQDDADLPHVDVVPDRSIDADPDVDVDVTPDRPVVPAPDVDVDVVPDGTDGTIDPGPGNADIDVDAPGVDVDVNEE